MGFAGFPSLALRVFVFEAVGRAVEAFRGPGLRIGPVSATRRFKQNIRLAR